MTGWSLHGLPRLAYNGTVNGTSYTGGVTVSPDLVHPEALHGGRLLHGVRDGEQHALHHAAEVTQVEEVVRLGRGGQQGLHGLLVDVQRAQHNLVYARLELTRKAPRNESCHTHTVLSSTFLDVT